MHLPIAPVHFPTSAEHGPFPFPTTESVARAAAANNALRPAGPEPDAETAPAAED
ncbi:hypothetical protein Q4S45_10240 [Massilia sp. R2A-15]|uniref:hypothetical protein n=1 Tax=Massilia sp. R2A-15 TaxID=3064278 RepID=UPI002733E449|nr:hypothetical protein [Massilia sp. R2A-15]WLI91474.1 hypothetical protein Q4S45_10240 [Massilia sp. R2A-15]